MKFHCGGLVGVLVAWAAASPCYAAPDELAVRLQGAVASLRACEKSKASSWAKQIERWDPELADLYRLAWLQGGKPVSIAPVEEGVEAPSGDAEKLGWKWDGEIWGDELDNGSGSLPSCAYGNTKLSELPRGPMVEILKPRLVRYKFFDPSIREALRDYLFIAAQAAPALLRSDLREECETLGLEMLFGASSTNSLSLAKRIAKSSERCKKLDLAYWPWVLIKAGDQELAEGDFVQATHLYDEASARLSGKQQVANFWPVRYRQALALALADSTEDAALGALQVALASAPAGQGAKTTVLQGLACERLARLEPRQGLELLKGLFGGVAFFDETARWIRACKPTQVHPLALALPGWAKGPRQKLVATGAALASSLAIGERLQAAKLATQLGKISHQYPALASHTFWNAMMEHRGGDASVIAAYRRAAEWNELDESWHHRWLAQPISEERVLGVSVDRLRSSSALALPATGDLPPMTSPAEPQARFRELFLKLARTRMAGQGK